MPDSCDLHGSGSVVDEVEDAVLAAACRPSWGERRLERLAYAMRILEEGSGDKGVGGCGDLLRK